MRSDVLDALEGREVPSDADADTQMAEIIGWYVGDASWWELIKEWMNEVGYSHTPPDLDS